MVNIVLAGGGTAGHTSPLIATADALRELDPEARIVAIGTPKGIETRVIPAAGLDLELIPPVPLPRKPSADLVKVPFRLAGAIDEAKRVLTAHRADVVVGFGGYVAMPAYLAARQLKIPVVVHEQNSKPGLANKVAAKFAEEVYTTFPDSGLEGGEFIGLPLRPAIATLDRQARHERSCEEYKLDPKLPVLLVSGGSQGARSINTAVRESYDALLAEGVNVLHVLGQKNYTSETTARLNAETGAAYKPVAYVDAMEEAYSAADLMLGRSGAGTVVEVAVIGLPSILVPLPHGNGEQARNAESLVHAGGARLLADSACSAAWITAEIPRMIKDADWLSRMSGAGQALMPADAAQVLAARILGVAGRR